MAYYIYIDTAGQWRWHFRASNGLIIAVSSEGYVNKLDCLNAIGLVKASGPAPIYE